MNLTELNYYKSEPSIEVNGIRTEESATAQETTAAADINDTPVPSVQQGYSKPDMAVETLIMFLVSGGEKREKDYIKYLEQYDNRRLKVVFISKNGQGLTPSQMYSEVTESLEEEGFIDYYGKYVTLVDGDIIYLISDVDEYGDELSELIKHPDTRYSWIISNPAFEIWLYYHYFDTPDLIREMEDIDIAQRSQWLKHKLHLLKKESGGVNPSESISLMETAIHNSKNNYSESESHFPDLFSTQMHVVAEHIMNILDDDFTKMLESRHTIASSFLQTTE